MHMDKKRIAIAAFVVLSVLVARSREVSAQQTQITVGPNVRVSEPNSTRAHTEISIAADPADPKHLIACSIITSATELKALSVVYVTFDGGISWRPTRETDEFSMGSDPACTIGSTGSAYFVADVRTSPDRKIAVVYPSKDGGRTWLPPIQLNSFMERPSIVVDTTNSRYRGNVYINGWSVIRDFNDAPPSVGIGLSRSLNNGQSFESPTVRLPLENDRHYTSAMGNCRILSDGTVICTYAQSNDDSPLEIQVQSIRLNSKLKVIASNDGGASFSNAVTVSDFHMLRRPPGTTNIHPNLAVDEGNGSFKDRIYVVWPNVSSGRSEISFAYSSDKGKTWSRPKVVNDDQPFDFSNPSAGPDDFMPSVAVNRNGVVGVLWYDRRESPDNLGWHVRFSASLDGGETFLPSVKVSEAPTRFDAEAKWPLFYWRAISGGGSSSLPGPTLNVTLEIMGQLFNGGDYGGIAADAAGVFHPLWVDNRTGLHQLWTAAISVKGVAKPDPELKDLENVTEKVTLEIIGAEYERKTDLLTVDLRLKNTSENNLRGPFKVRVVGLRSDIGGQVAITNESNRTGVGALLDLGETGKTLRSSESTGPTRLVFQLRNTRPLRQDRDVKLRLVNLDMLVFGHVEK
jgi:hypothetical protein